MLLLQLGLFFAQLGVLLLGGFQRLLGFAQLAACLIEFFLQLHVAQLQVFQRLNGLVNLVLQLFENFHDVHLSGRSVK